MSVRWFLYSFLAGYGAGRGAGRRQMYVRAGVRRISLVLGVLAPTLVNEFEIEWNYFLTYYSYG